MAETTAPMSLSDYAAHLGVSVQAVSRAVKRGRLARSIGMVAGRPKILDVAGADAEWASNSMRRERSLKPPLFATLTDQPTTPGHSRSHAENGSSGRQHSEPGTLSLQDAMALEKDWKARIAELEYKHKSGELVNTKDVESRIVGEYTRCRSKLLGLSRRLKADIPQLTYADMLRIEAIVREALQDLASAPASDAPIEEAS